MKCSTDIQKDIESKIIKLLPDFGYDPQYKEFSAARFYWNKNQSKFVHQIMDVNTQFKTRVLFPIDVNTRPGTYEMRVPQELVDKYFKAYNGGEDLQTSLFGIEDDNQEQLEFHINTLNAVSDFLEAAGIETRLVPEILGQNGSVVEGAVAAANFIKGTVDIVDSLEKRPQNWNKLPEEAAHFWYRLLRENSPLKKALWDSMKTEQKAIELKGPYLQAYQNFDDLKEEAIGQLIAESIKRIEDQTASAADYSFLKKFVEWINELIKSFQGILDRSDPFEIAAMKILSSDLSDLMSFEEYNNLNNQVYFTDKITADSSRPVDYTIIEDLGRSVLFNDGTFSWRAIEGIMSDKNSPNFETQEELDLWVLANVPEHDKRQKRLAREVIDNQRFFDRLISGEFRKRTKYLPKTLSKYYTIISSGNPLELPKIGRTIDASVPTITKKLTAQDIDSLDNYVQITPALKALPGLLKKYKNNPISLGEPLKTDSAKKPELVIFNKVKDLIKSENPGKKSITAEEFANEVHLFLEANYMLSFADENEYNTYRIGETFRFQNVGVKSLRHNKISLRFNDTYYTKSSHFRLSPSAWGNLTPFSTDGTKVDAVLLHEIQNDNKEYLEGFTPENINLDEIVRQYEVELHNTFTENLDRIETGGSSIVKNSDLDMSAPQELPGKGYTKLKYLISQAASGIMTHAIFKDNLREQINLYESLGQSKPEEIDEEVQKYYVYKDIISNIKRRGGLQALLSEGDIQEIDSIIRVANSPIGLEGIKDKKRYFAESVVHIEKRLNDKIIEIYGESWGSYLLLQAPAKPLPRRQQRRETRIRHGVATRHGNSSNQLDTNLDWLFTFSEKQALDNISQIISNNKRAYVTARNAAVAYGFNRSLYKLSEIQFNKIVDNYKYNLDLIKRLTDLQAQKELSQRKVGTGKSEDELSILEDQKAQQFEKFEALRQEALEKRTKMEKEYSKLGETVKQTLEIEKLYFVPLVHHLIQRHIQEYGKDVPLYMSGFDITMLTQGHAISASLYSGPEEVDPDITQERVEELEREAAEKLGIISDLEDPDYKTKIKEFINRKNPYEQFAQQNRLRYSNALLEQNSGRPLRTGTIYNMMSQIPGVNLVWEPHIKGIYGDPGGYRLDLSEYNYKTPLLFALEPTATEVQPFVPEVPDSPQEQNENGAETAVIQIIDKFSDTIGAEYELVTESEAKEITKNSKNPWTNQAGFFFGPKIYFVKGKFNSQTAFHEFSHPFVRAIQKTNPELFESLFLKLSQTELGQTIIAQVTEDIGADSPLFKEEVLVTAMSRFNQGIDQDEDMGLSFMKVIADLLYALKQFLRKVFGTKIKISELSPDTTIKDLVKILNEGSKLDIDIDSLSREDVVAYERSYQEEIKNMGEVAKKHYEPYLESITNFYGVLNKLIAISPQSEEVKELLRSDFDRAELPLLKAGIAKFVESTPNKLQTIKDIIKYREESGKAMVETLARLDYLMGKIYEHLRKIQGEKDNPDNLQTAYYYDHFLNYWSQWIDGTDTIKGFREIINEAGMTNTPLKTLINGLAAKMQDSRDLLNKPYSDASKNIIWDTISPQIDKINEYYTNILEKLKKDGAPADVYNHWHKEYYGTDLARGEQEELDRLLKQKKNARLTNEQELTLLALVKRSMSGKNMTREKFDKIFSGELGDSNALSYFLEGYLYNPDAVSGGFALFVKNKLTEVDVDWQRDANKMIGDLGPVLKAAGYSPAQTRDLFDRIAGIETVSVFDDKTLTMIDKQVPRLLSEFTGHDKDQVLLEYAVKEASREYHVTGSDADKLKLRKASKDLAQWKIDFMHQKYIPAYYTKFDLLEGEVGEEANFRMREALDNLNAEQSSLSSQSDYLNAQDKIQFLLRQYRLLADTNKIDGSSKDNGTVQGKFEFDVALRLKEYRAFKLPDPNTGELVSPFDWIEREGLLLENYWKYHQELLNEGMEDFSDQGNARMQAKMNTWLLKNTKVSIKPDFWKDKRVFTDRLNQIQDRIYDTKGLDDRLANKVTKAKESKVKVGDLYMQLFDLTKPYRDEDGQPIGVEMSPDRIAKIKQIEKDIIKESKNLLKASGSSGKVQERINVLMLKDRTPEEQLELNDLFQDIKDLTIITPALRAELTYILGQLADMKEKEATVYYCDILNSWLDKLDTKIVKDKLDTDLVSPENSGSFLDTEIILNLTSQNSDFKAWFQKNHLKREKFDPELKDTFEYWDRVYVWSAVKPTDLKYYNKTEIKDKNNKVINTVYRVPNQAYFTRIVKPMFQTGYNPKTGKVKPIVGVHITNRGSQAKQDYLPRLDVPNQKYINPKFEELRRTDPKTFKALEEVKKWHLKIQEGAPRKSRLWYDIPRYRKSVLEILQTKQAKQILKGTFDTRFPIFSLLVDHLKYLWTRAKDAPESGFNWQDDIMLAKADIFDNQFANIPVTGLWDLDIDEISPDIMQGMLKYMGSIKRQKKLIEIHPVAQAMKASLPDNVLGKKLNSDSFFNRNMNKLLPGKELSRRKKTINNFIAREFEGQVNADNFSDNTIAVRTSQALFGRASFGLFALNIPSALKNAIGPRWQGMLLAAAGDNMTWTNFLRGESWATQTMGDISFTVYDQKNKPLRVQQVELFDPSHRLDSKLPTNLSRTFTEDVAGLTWLYNFRKWMETHATLQLFSGIMYTQKVKQGDKEIDYLDAFELDSDNIIRLKSGIDPEYSPDKVVYTVLKGDTLTSIAEKHNITPAQVKERIGKDTLTEGEEITLGTSKEFKNIRNKVEIVINNASGAYGKFSQPEAQRYLLFRFISFLRRYFTTMALDRWGVARPNYALGKDTEGFYITIMKMGMKLFSQNPAWMAHLTPRERVAGMKFMMEVGSLLVLMLFILPWIGWDEDDPEKYEVMRRRSGAAQIPGLTEPDPDHPFALGGYLHNHAISLALQVQAENAAWLPFPQKAFGLDDYVSLISPKSIVMGPTVDTYYKMFTLGFDQATGDPNAYYKRDIGPYKWQQKGGSKFMTQAMRSIGMTGTSLDPSMAVKNFMGVQSRGIR